jgi:Phage tail protein
VNIVTSLSIDSLVFDGNSFILEEISGLETPLTRLPRYNLPGASGAFISNALYGERAIKIKGTVNAPDGQATTYLLNRTTLINALNYKRDVNNNIVPQTLTIGLANGQVLTTQAYVDTPLSMGFSPDQTDYEEFLITLVAPDSNLYSSTQITNSITFPIGGGTAIPTAIPISLAPSSGGSAIVINIGSTTSYPIITINAPVVNPYVINSTVGDFLKLNYTLNIGDLPLIIDCNTQTIYQGANLKNGIQTQDSTFWGVVSGNNFINYSGSSGSGSVNISFAPTFIGV